LIALRVGVERNVVRTQENGDRAWCVIDPVRGALRDVLIHTQTQMKEERQRRQQNAHTYTYT